MRYELFEEVLQYKLARGESQLGDRDDDDDEKAFALFLMIELILPCMFDLNMVSCIVCLHTTFEMVQIDSSDDRRVDMCKFICWFNVI